MTWLNIPSTASIIIQGMTGKEGSRMAHWMLENGARMSAGVTPGKGGQTVEGKPIFDSVAQARAHDKNILLSCIVVPAPRVWSATEEALTAGIKYIYVLTEGVPVHDVLRMKQAVMAHGALLLGPSSVGVLVCPNFRLGYLGGERPFEKIHDGEYAVLSNSGGMANELMMALTRVGHGIHYALAMGGDRMVGTSLEEELRACEADARIQRLAIFLEPGHPFLSRVAEGSFSVKKPTIIFLPGDSLESLPRGRPYGHTGTILDEQGPRGLADLRDKIRAQGVTCVSSMQEFINYV